MPFIYIITNNMMLGSKGILALTWYLWISLLQAIRNDSGIIFNLLYYKESIMALNKSTLSEQIYQILRSDILHQRIPLGEKLTLKNLQAQFEVSSTPIR